MLNGRTMLLSILCVLFVPSAVLAQSQSATDSIIEKIYQSEISVRAHINTKIDSVDGKISEINTKIGTINTNVAVNTTNIGTIKGDIDDLEDDIDDLNGTLTRVWIGILILLIGSVAIPIGLYFLKGWWENRNNKGSETATSIQATQVSQSEVTPTQVPQEDVSKTPPPQATKVSESKETNNNALQGKDFPQGDELKNELKKDYHAKRRKV